MLRWFTSRLAQLMTEGRRKWLFRASFTLVLLLPILVLAWVNYAQVYREATEAIHSKRRALSLLSASIVQEKLGNVVNLGLSLATRPRVVEYVARGDWDGAMQVLNEVPKTFPFIERLIFFDPAGVIRSDLPAAVPPVIGQSRADRDWYKKTRRNAAPYVSGIFTRGTDPQKNIVAVTVPVLSPAQGRKPEMIGILLLQLSPALFQDWIRHLDIGPRSLIYIVDQFGRIVFHPGYDVRQNVVDFSTVGIVRRLMAGKGGVERNFNPVESEERLAAYEPVARFGWGVVVTQPVPQAYAERTGGLRRLLLTYGLALFAAAVMAGFILASLILSRKAELAAGRAALEREKLIADLTHSLENIKTLKGLLPICASCKKIRDDKGYWSQLEIYLHEHTDADFSHGICPECAKKFYDDFFKEKKTP